MGHRGEAMDLGVLFDSKLTFQAHYQHIVSRGNQLIGFISRSTSGFKHSRSMLYLYYALVRPILEYCSVVWSPFYNVHCTHIERVQKKILNILCFRSGLSRELRSYSQKLTKFRVISLESRRNQSSLVYLYKILHSLIDSPHLLSLLNFNTRFRARNYNNNTFSLQVYTNNTSYFNPIVRMCRLYNDILANDKDCDFDIFNLTLPQFHRRVKQIIT